MTFVVEFEDGKEPSVGSRMQICGGKVISVAWSDYRDDHFSEDEKDMIKDVLNFIPRDNPLRNGILQRLELLTS
ncbi:MULTISPECIES: hypothetical protein [unclassified Enterobacter cloacae complex]|uniref:hypothetical protein n=1 Tax=unclassified Enterobacter cloacae complex TaxID=2757714 RepID=UPI001873576A|nr:MULTISPECIES: hypothetical protein [unclassified Enterobacter cloacae complex]MBE4946290.1 hypothetical protein [Enterobacter cloacae complex sp. P1B]MBE4971457.1 hypothetical protein [Enterobacter cloacae complex sp. P11RS]